MRNLSSVTASPTRGANPNNLLIKVKFIFCIWHGMDLDIFQSLDIVTARTACAQLVKVAMRYNLRCQISKLLRNIVDRSG
jgi:hypothetical protein